MTMNEQELREAIARGHEVQDVEFKAACSKSDPLMFAKVLRAALGMSNRRDGGYVVVGVKEVPLGVQLDGLSEEQLGTWQYDQIAAAFAPYADPSIRFELETQVLDGNKVLVLRVSGFDEVPVLCKKQLTVNGQVILKEGGCYVRSVRKPETSEVSSYEDMRTLLDCSIEKRLRAYVATSERSGVLLSSIVSDSKNTVKTTTPPDDVLFRCEIEDV